MSNINDQIEITNLIAEAVANAKARRNEILNGEASLSSLSDEQSTLIAGGKKFEELDRSFLGIVKDRSNFPSDFKDKGTKE